MFHNQFQGVFLFLIGESHYAQLVADLRMTPDTWRSVLCFHMRRVHDSSGFVTTEKNQFTLLTCEMLSGGGAKLYIPTDCDCEGIEHSAVKETLTNAR